MSAQAESRWKAKNRRDLESQTRPVEFEVMDRLNDMPKHLDAGTYRADMAFKCDGSRWWALDANRLFAGFGYHYPSLQEAVTRWRVVVTGYDATSDTWYATPDI